MNTSHLKYRQQKEWIVDGVVVATWPLKGYQLKFKEYIEHLKPKSILLIGGAPYSLPHHLTHYNFDIVEPSNEDPWGFKKGLKVFKDFSEIDEHKDYELVIVDAFVGEKIPEPIMELIPTLNYPRILVNVILASDVHNLRRGFSVELVGNNFILSKGLLKT